MSSSAARETTGESTGGFVEEVDVEAIVAVGGEGVDRCNAAPRAEGRPFRVLRLRRHLGHGIRIRGRRRVGVAEREPTDVAGRAQVTVQQCGRERLHVGDVVEVVALRVEREVDAGIHIESQHGIH